MGGKEFNRVVLMIAVLVRDGKSAADDASSSAATVSAVALSATSESSSAFKFKKNRFS